MRPFIILSVIMSVSAATFAVHAQGYGTGSNPYANQHQGYTTNQGTYVAPHYQTNPNNTARDNFGTQGNTNPYTGQTGTRRPGW